MTRLGTKNAASVTQVTANLRTTPQGRHASHRKLRALTPWHFETWSQRNLDALRIKAPAWLGAGIGIFIISGGVACRRRLLEAGRRRDERKGQGRRGSARQRARARTRAPAPSPPGAQAAQAQPWVPSCKSSRRRPPSPGHQAAGEGRQADRAATAIPTKRAAATERRDRRRPSSRLPPHRLLRHAPPARR